MAWIEVHDTLPDHWKADELAQELGTSLPLTIGHLVCLWLKAIRFKPGGKLIGVSKVTIAKWAQWQGNPEQFADALVKHKWLDKLGGRGKTLGIHDWETYTRSFRKAIADRDRKRRARGGGASEDSPGTGAVDRTGPDQTGTEQTRPDQSGGVLRSGSIAAQIASAYIQMNPGVISQQKAIDAVQFRLKGKMNAEAALARVMDREMCEGKKLWDVLDPITPNGEATPETMKEYRQRRDLKKEVDAKFGG